MSTTETPNTWQQITTYNNFYEFGVDKKDAATYSKSLKTSPWSIAMEGEVAKPAVWHLEDVLKGRTLEERIYRHRCVEGWSMVIPWVGFPLRDLIAQLQPTSKARFVEFTTLNDPNQMPGIRASYLRWPYIEGLRMDEAMHPLTILAVGLYDEVLPNQDGAPIRLVVPWKYGFKSIKSIVRIRLVEQQPVGAWQREAPQRVRVLRERQPNRRSSALEPGEGSPVAGLLSKSGRRKCSTATAIRLRASMPAWI